MNQRLITTVVAAAALVVPTAAVAKPDHSKPHHKHAAKSHGKKVMYVFKGTFTAGAVDVTSGNAHVRKGGFVGQSVTFDFADAKIRAADTNGDRQVDITDVKDGDKVLVQARVARSTSFADVTDAIPARKLIDKTNPRVDDDDHAETS